MCTLRHVQSLLLGWIFLQGVRGLMPVSYLAKYNIADNIILSSSDPKDVVSPWPVNFATR